MKRARARWSRAVLVCGKCSKKLDGGFGPDGDRPLAKALRKRLGLKKGPKAAAGLVETRCLGLCPKRAVAVVDAARPEEWLVVPPGADLDALAETLGLAADRSV
ncbi:(2Fe-2S) ferredoxin domain-containing protein [Sphingomonas sp. ac-8]|uniref:(2Fe-2S) ferredoxin domain-containing protein n=1 Tax=Sphingomonas sp. ac-8 TaxID=3242977 RepID=UPI003A7FFADE